MRVAEVQRFLPLGILLFLALPCRAQMPQTAVPPDASKPKATVYLPGFSTLNPSSEADKNLGDFVDRLLSYRFSELSRLRVNIANADRSCGREAPQARGVVVQSPVTSQKEDSGPVYLVQGSVEFHPAGDNDAAQAAQTAPSPDLILNYQLFKFVNCNPESLMRRSEPISRARLLESLTVMADTMALRLGQEINRRTRVDVLPISATQASPDEQQFAAALTDSLVQGIAQSDDFEPNDLRQPSQGPPAAYTLETSLRFSHSPNVFKLFGAEARITLHLRVGDHTTTKPGDNSPSYSLTPSPIGGFLSQRADILANASAAAVKGISYVRDAREGGLPEKLSELKLDDLLNRSKEALCDGMDASCTPKPEAAMLLLQQAAKEEAPGDFRAQEWTARALSVSGKYVESAKQYADVLRSISSPSPEVRLPLLTATGDSWYRAQSFTNATASYDQAAQILQQHPELTNPADINVRRSLSHRFSGDRLGALDVLLHPLGKLPAPAVLQRELKHAVSNLADTEIPEGVARLEVLSDQPEMKPILVAAYQKQFDAMYRHGQYPEAESVARQALDLGIPEQAPILNYDRALAHFVGARDSSSSPEQKTREYRFSSDLLREILEVDPTSQSFAPLQLQLSICADYLDDKACVRRTVALLDRVDRNSIPLGIQMDLAELDFLDSSLESASARVAEALRQKELDPRLKAVGYFYEVWFNLSKGRNRAADKSFSNWQDSLKSLRKNGTDINWVFGAAGRYLNAQDAPLTNRNKELLLNMIKAMEDLHQPIPRFES